MSVWLEGRERGRKGSVCVYEIRGKKAVTLVDAHVVNAASKASCTTARGRKERPGI